MPKTPTPRGPASRGGRRTTLGANVSPAAPGLPNPYGNLPPANTDTAATRAATSRDALYGRISYTAGPTLTRYSTYPADGISAEMIKTALRNADLGFPRVQAELFEQVRERDAHLRGVVKARIYEVSGKPFRIQPRDETDLAARVAKFCRAVVDEIDGFDSDIDDLLQANGDGYAASEIVYAIDRVRFPVDNSTITVPAIVPRSLEWVHGKHFEFNAITDEPLLVLAGGRISLPPNKFVFHGAADTGFYERRGYMRPATMLHAMKAWAMRDWLLYEALFAVPQVTGTYPGDREEYEAQREVFQSIMRDWGKGVPAFIPDEIKFEIGAAQSGGNSSGVHAAICGFVNQEMSKLIQGETLTTEVGNVGAYAATETHADIRHAFVRSDANKLARTLHDQLLTSIVDLNVDALAAAFGAAPADVLRAVPRIQWRIDRETSPTQRVQNFIALANAGVPIGLDQVYDECGIDTPREGAPLLNGDPVTVAKGGAVVGSGDASDGATNPDPAAETAAAESESETTEAPATEAAPAAQPAASAAPHEINLTPTDIASIVRVREARASQGLPPFGDERDDMTVTEYQARNAATVAAAAAAQDGATAPTTAPDSAGDQKG